MIHSNHDFNSCLEYISPHIDALQQGSGSFLAKGAMKPTYF